jgi:hypothetical protein
MHCEEVSARLPWLLNGTLEDAEAREVPEHLAGSAACREALEGMVATHLEGCADCRGELALAHESRRLESAPEGAGRWTARLAFGRWAAVAAGLAAGLVIGAWWGGGRAPQQAPDDRGAEVLAGRVTTLEREIARARDAAAGARAQLEALRAPQLNLPVFELLPAGVRRSAGDTGNSITVPAGAIQVALVLGGDEPPAGPATLEIRDARGEIVWRGEGLRPGPLAAYTVAVPVALLADGDYTLTVRAEGARAATYPLRVRHEH